MKSVLSALFLALLSVTPAFAFQTVCHSTYGIQLSDTLPSKAQITFEYNKDTIDNVKGFIFVKNQWEDTSTEFTAENSYRGFFDLGSMDRNPNYRPSKYKNHIQFKNFDATYTDGLESGMWGSLVIEKNPTTPTFSAYYIFQAGDHMGGTLHFKCSAK